MGYLKLSMIASHLEWKDLLVKLIPTHFSWIYIFGLLTIFLNKVHLLDFSFILKQYISILIYVESCFEWRQYVLLCIIGDF